MWKGKRGGEDPLEKEMATHSSILEGCRALSCSWERNLDQADTGLKEEGQLAPPASPWPVGPASVSC